MRPNRVALVIVVGLVVALGFVAADWIRAGLSARDQPSTLEVFLARRVRSFAIPASARSAANPVTLTPDVLVAARAHFADHCASCHANDGSGQTEIGQNLYPKAPDLRKPETQNLTDGELFYIIHNGIRLTGMPAFGEETSGKPDLDSWKLVHFIRHLPNITPEELGKMNGMNPKSPDELKEEEAIRKFLEGDDSQPPVRG